MALLTLANDSGRVYSEQLFTVHPATPPQMTACMLYAARKAREEFPHEIPLDWKSGIDSESFRQKGRFSSDRNSRASRLAFISRSSLSSKLSFAMRSISKQQRTQ